MGILFAWAAAGDAIPFSAVQLFIEFNSTDDDAGIQPCFDGAAWKEAKILGPDGRTILEIEADRGPVKKIGLPEVRFQSEEPSLAEILAEFPPGDYRFEGKTVEGDELVGTATLSHDIPPAPEIRSPSNGATVERNNTVIRWKAIAGIAGFQVIVEQAELGVMMTVDLSDSTTRLKLPPEFLQGNTEYKFEVLAISPNGNRTITEGTVKTMP